jgi:HlyD family type I secretion membrane fusion protein
MSDAFTADTASIPQSGPKSDLMSPARDSVLPELRKGGVIAGVFFLGFMGWAAFIPLDAAATADGVVAVAGNRQAVQHRDGGIVTRLNVQEGQMVKEGDLLLQISASELVAQERGLAGEAISLQAQRARLVAERAGAARLVAPPEFTGLEGEDKRLADEAMASQQMVFDTRRSSRANERSVLEQRIRQYDEQISGIAHQQVSNELQKQLLSEELEGLQKLVPSGYVALNRVRAMEREVASLEGRDGSLRSDASRLNEAIGEARLEIISIDRRTMEEIAAEMRDLQVRLDEVMPKLNATRQQITRATVRAPATGQVVALKVFTEGGVVLAGDTLMEIVPTDRRLVIEAKAAPTDADDLTIGMTTQIRFPALQEKDLPIIEGVISKVSADSFEDQRTGGHYFEIEVQVPPESLELLKTFRTDGGIRAGLPAQVVVPLRKRTALGYLLEPLSSTFWKVGREH